MDIQDYMAVDGTVIFKDREVWFWKVGLKLKPGVSVIEVICSDFLRTF